MSANAPTSLRRHAAGFFVAPLVVPLLFTALALVHEAGLDAPSGKVRARMLEAVGFAAATVAPIAYAAAFAMGVPVLVALGSARRRRASWVVGASTGVAAIALAVIFGAAPSASCDDPPWSAAALFGAGLGAVLGAIVSAIHCRVAGIRWRAAAVSRRGAAPGACA